MRFMNRTSLLSATLLAGLPLAAAAAPLVTAPVNEAVTIAIGGERSPNLAAARDIGPLADSVSLTHNGVGWLAPQCFHHTRP